MQTSKEVVKSAIHFKTPDRLPISSAKYETNDVHDI